MSGAISSRDCSPGWVSGSTYSSGDIVKGSGNWPGSLSNEADGESLCYQANTNPSPGTFETGQWDVIPCSYSKSLDNLKTLFLGDGLRLTDYTEHCSGDSATIVANPRIAISGVDCDDNGVAQASFNQLSFRGGDFFLQPSPIIDFISKYDYTKGDRLNISGKCYVATDDPPIVSSPTSSWLSTYWKEIPCEDSCPIEVCTEGWTISGSTGTPRCTGETDQGSLSIGRIKDLKLGAGLYMSELDTGHCCPGNSVTIASAAQFSVSGANCSGGETVGSITGTNYHTRDFCVEIDNKCEATIRSRGIVISGESGACDGPPMSADNIKEIRLDTGLYISDLISGDCCSGQIMTLASKPLR